MATKDKKPSKDDFIKHYVLTGCKNGRKAAILAGYSEKTADQAASRLLKDVKVLTAIEDHKKAGMKDFIWSKEKKLKVLESIAENCVSIDGEDKMNNPTAAIAAMKEHNLMMGDNAPTVTESTVTNQSLAEKLSGGSKR